jgi:recombination protein RecR
VSSRSGAPSPFARAAGGGLPERLARTAQLLGRLPGVGEKTAQRFALYLATAEESVARDLGKALSELRDHVLPCHRCGNIAEAEPGEDALCSICRDGRRDPQLLCVVARVQDLLAIERSGVMRGRYFVLGRLLSPLEGIGAEDLPLDALKERVRADGVTEVLVATPSSVDGEATALLLVRAFGSATNTAAEQPVRVTRIASGVPHGGELEFADQVTLGRAIEGRKSFG